MRQFSAATSIRLRRCADDDAHGAQPRKVAAKAPAWHEETEARQYTGEQNIPWIQGKPGRRCYLQAGGIVQHLAGVSLLGRGGIEFESDTQAGRIGNLICSGEPGPEYAETIQRLAQAAVFLVGAGHIERNAASQRPLSCGTWMPESVAAP